MFEQFVKDQRGPVDWNKFVDPWEATDRFEQNRVVAIDFDETISDDPVAWLSVMKTLELSGYHVVVVTWRASNTAPQELQFLVDRGYKIYYTSLRCKRDYMKLHGIDVSIWIDDNPDAIVADSPFYKQTVN